MRTGVPGVLLIALCPVFAWAAELAHTDGPGRLAALSCDGELVEIGSDIRVALPRWTEYGGMDPWNVSEVRSTNSGGRREWTGRIRVGPGTSVRYRQTIEETGGVVRLRCSATAETNLAVEGVFFFLRFPQPAFTGAGCDLLTGRGVSGRGVMPVRRPADPHFLSGEAEQVVVARSDHRTVIEVGFEGPRGVTVQDNRAWNEAAYSLYTRFAEGTLLAGQEVTLQVTVRVQGYADHSPVRLRLLPGEERYRLDGFGGNFVYGIESPVTRFTRERLRMAWARTQMSLRDWEPRNDNGDPAETEWSVLETQDRPDSNLHREFLLAQALQTSGVPLCLSVWDLPEWMYRDPGKGPDASRRRIATDKWPEVLESIGSYLRYVRFHYGVEPALFSFNESDEGVRVLFSAQEHRDAIRRIGAYLETLGLRTKLLLGDTASFRKGTAFVDAAAADPEAMSYVGALGFHSYGTGTAEEYGVWAGAAERWKLPLLVAEAGVDASAWQMPGTSDTFYYALQELQLYQTLLLHARPRAILEWEFTGDYSMVKVGPPRPAGDPELTPLWRYWFLHHFCNLTPRRSRALGVVSDQSPVLFTAFAGEEQGRPVYALHIANLGGSRPAEIVGLPWGVRHWRVVRSGETDQARDLGMRRPLRGRLDLDLAPQSLTTLTGTVGP